MDAYYLVYNVLCDDVFGCIVYFNSLLVYRKSIKIKKINCIGLLYYFFIIYINYLFFLYVWFDFF